jgi:hypothetical protein
MLRGGIITIASGKPCGADSKHRQTIQRTCWLCPSDSKWKKNVKYRENTNTKCEYHKFNVVRRIVLLLGECTPRRVLHGTNEGVRLKPLSQRG